MQLVVLVVLLVLVVLVLMVVLVLLAAKMPRLVQKPCSVWFRVVFVVFARHHFNHLDAQTVIVAI